MTHFFPARVERRETESGSVLVGGGSFVVQVHRTSVWREPRHSREHHGDTMDTLGLALVIAARPGIEHCRSALPDAPVVTTRTRRTMAQWWLTTFTAA